jgi:hypothetical protein
VKIIAWLVLLAAVYSYAHIGIHLGIMMDTKEADLGHYLLFITLYAMPLGALFFVLTLFVLDWAFNTVMGVKNE